MGTVLATTLLAELPELGPAEPQADRRLGRCGSLQPRQRRPAWEVAGLGRAPVRAAFLMAALVGARHNPVISSFYQRLLSTGKAKNVALVACMRKLVTILNAMLNAVNAFRAKGYAVLIQNPRTGYLFTYGKS